MVHSIPLGRIFGVRVGANWSVLVILALIAWLLATGTFQGATVAASWAAAVITALVFLLSLLAHEISHAVLARRNGVQVQGITLWLFGGVAQLEGEADTPGADLRIAGVGPLVSALLGGVFYGFFLLVVNNTDAGLLTGALWWLAIINVALAVFNLIPAAPLDGGRVLRSALWRRSGDRYRASITAAGAGRVFGIVLIGLGIVEFIVLPGVIGALWLALIGWFLINAAGAEQRQARHQQRLADVRVAEVMSPQPFTAPAWLTAEQFAEHYAMRYRFSAFPLVDRQGRFVGLVTLDRLRAVPRGERAGTRLADVADGAARIPTAGPGDGLGDLLPRMAAAPGRRAVVLDDDRRVVGIVAQTDVSRATQPTGLRGRAR